MRKRFNLLLAVLGTILPYYFLISFLTRNGLDFELIWQQFLFYRENYVEQSG
jgi:hypothetical protein